MDALPRDKESSIATLIVGDEWAWLSFLWLARAMEPKQVENAVFGHTKLYCHLKSPAGSL